jgi:hypothetical protein
MPLNYGRGEKFYGFPGQRILFSFGRRETQKITCSDNPPTKVALVWSRHESKKVTGNGHYAWTS